ncbi:MAG: HlyD family secretion protein [Pseudomonadales bacterium]|nr:HlyD family secretion protein [Pseudomonadales bacterium]
MTDSATTPSTRTGALKRLRHLLFLLLGPIAIAVIAGWFYLQGGRFVSTDNAYVKTDILTISSNLSGLVTDVLVEESDEVVQGQLLLRVDDAPYKIALARAEANLANVRSNIESLRAEYTNKQLEIAKAETDLAFREREVQRLSSLVAEKSVPEIQYDQAVYARDSAERSLAEKRQALAVVHARLMDPAAAVDEHPQVRAALAELDKARLDLSHVEVLAPTDGVVVNVGMHPGENVIAGAPVMSLVSDQKIWMEANFKETDLTNLQVGQAAEVHIDSYPEHSWHAHVASIRPATGAEFALLPAQNSSGNWIKVVQRVTVRLALDDYAGTPALASGLSATVRVDTGQERHLPGLASR